MADEVLDTLKINVTAETDEAQKKIAALAAAVKAAFDGRGSNKNGDRLKSISDAANGINENASSNVQGLATALGTLGGVKISATIANQLTRIGAALKSIDGDDIAKLKDLTDSIGAINASGGVGNIKVQQPKSPAREIKQEAIKPTVDIKEAQIKIKSLGEVISDVAKDAKSEKISPQIDLRTTITDARSQFEEIGRELENNFDFGKKGFALSNAVATIKENLGGIGGAARTAFFFMANGMSAALPYAKKLASALAKIGLAMGKATGKFLSAPFVALGKQISGVTTKLKGFLTRIGRIALYRAIRSAIKEITQGFKEGIDNAYEWSKINGGQLAKSMNSLATSAQYVKNSLGAMAAPLLNALAPAIDYVADKLVALINLFNQVFAKFTGASTWMRAKKQAVEYEGAANSATKATKKFKATILGIDEINPLNDNSDNGGGGGGGGADYGSMFEEVPVDSSIADFVQDIKDAIDAGDWEGVGSLISDKLVYAMDQIDWNAVYAKADKFGVNFASFLNGLFETKVDPKTGIEKNVFTAVGETVAGALNTSLHVIDKIGEKFDFESFGSGLSLGITRFLNSIDWKTALSAAENWGEGIAKAINGFLNKKDKDGKGAFDALGETVANLINTGLAYLKTFVPTIDGNSLGGNIASAIITAIQGINWESALKSASDIGEKIAETLNGFLTKKDKKGNSAFSSMGQAVANAVVAAVNSWSSFTLNFKFDELGTQIASAINSFFKTMNENNGWAKLITVTGDTFAGVVTAITKAFKNIDKDQIVQAVSNAIGGAIGEGLKLITFTAESVSNIAEGIGKLFSGIFDKDWAKANILDPLLKGFCTALKVDVSGEDIWVSLTKAIYNLVAKTWNAGIDLLAAGSPLPQGFWNLFKMQLKEDTSDSESAGKALAKSLKNGLSSEGATDELTKGGKSAGKKIGDGIRGTDFSGVAKSISSGVTSEDAKSKYNSAGKIAGKSVTSGAKGYSFGSIAKSIVSALTGKDSKEQYKSAGQSAATSFESGFKSKTITVSIQGKLTTIKAPKELNTVDLAKKGVRVEYTFAGGGFPQSGQMFIANENGIPPEYVGSFGNKTAVANTDQIVEGISSGVYAANQEQNALLRQQNALLAQQNELLAQQSGGGQVTVSSIVTGVDRYNRRAGKTVMATA